MQQPTPALSSIFRATGVEPKERGRLDATLARVGELCEALSVGQKDVEVSSVLSELRVDFALHFAREESDEYFGAVQRERPSLSHELAELRREHVALLEELDALRALTADERRASEVEGALEHLVAEFRIHEYKETDLLQESVLRDDGIGAD